MATHGPARFPADARKAAVTGNNPALDDSAGAGHGAQEER
jgi:hypothetical protein